MIIFRVEYKHLGDNNEEFEHYVLMTGFDKDSIYVHDPGLPGRKDLRVRKKEFIMAWMHRKGEYEAIVISEPK